MAAVLLAGSFGKGQAVEAAMRGRFRHMAAGMSGAKAQEAGKFTTGSTMRHVVVMTATGSIGLLAIFIVDALNLFYIAMLGVEELAAAIGFASALMFFTISTALGLTIATSAVVSRALGRGDRETAARLGGASMIFLGVVMLAVALVAWPFLENLLYWVGARDRTLELATRFMQIVLPSTPIVAIGMGATGILRAAGDARRAMYVTLISGMATAVLDPILIFGFDLGLDGAAIATVISRFVLLAVGIYGVHYVHRLMKIPSRIELAAAFRPFFAVGVPAIMTQVATPVGNTYVTVEIAEFGDQAVAGWAIVGRILPVAFAGVFALSGAVGPIIGQNIGAQYYDRARDALRDAMIFIIVYVLIVWGLMALAAEPLAGLFNAEGEAREIVVFFCRIAAASFVLYGVLFVANAAFNNLGYATYSTVFSWGRSTLGVIPFVWVGAQYYGAIGVIAGWALGAVPFGIAAIIVAFRVVAKLAREGTGPDDVLPGPPPSSHSPFSTAKAATFH